MAIISIFSCFLVPVELKNIDDNKSDGGYKEKYLEKLDHGGGNFYSREVKTFDHDVSSNHTSVFLPGRAPLSKWQWVRIHGTKKA